VRRTDLPNQPPARAGLIVTEVPDVPSDILRPRESWADKSAYDATAKKLAGLFNKNFKTYAAGASAEVKAAAPAA
jgi:phosphoenolpyruvate carboxykinase (ATP)